MGIIKRFIERYIVADDPYDKETQDHVQGMLAEQVQKELDVLPSDIRHLVALQVQPPYHSGSPEQVRTLARQFKGSMG